MPIRIRGLRAAVRRLWPDRNPLRRATDHAEAMLVAGLFLLFLVCAPLLSLGAWHWAAAAAHRTQLEQQAASRQVSAVVLQNTPPAVLGVQPSSLVTSARARWVAPGGAVHTGTVPVMAGTRAGSRVPVWVGRNGQQTAPPLEPSQVTMQAAQAAVGAPFVLALPLGGIWLAVRRVLNRRRLAAWEAGWAAFGPRWTRRT
ncbi:MAG: hypothetical protein JOY82_08365 [Streptosporangiaceae bacterium]|nr:hypothetical protein [Streptosporangiaceae bacterium]MBV9854527.1 hypothetical protein [Streptosporangiaceae bacterium]